jgi:hypothetical protein
VTTRRGNYGAYRGVLRERSLSRPGVQTGALLMAHVSRRPAGSTVCLAKTICVCRLVHVKQTMPTLQMHS